MRKALCLLVVLGIWAKSPAPIQDPSHQHRGKLSSTEQELEQQQANQKQIGQVGTVLQKDGGDPVVSGEQDSARAAKALAQASPNHAAVDSQQALAAANADVKSKEKKPMKTVFWGAFMLALGFGAFAVFRAWANKNLPEPPTSSKKSNW